VAAVLRRSFARDETTPRWVVVRDCRQQPVEIALEDIEQSRSFFAKPMSERTRRQ
jgi:hypothetical protein